MICCLNCGVSSSKDRHVFEDKYQCGECFSFGLIVEDQSPSFVLDFGACEKECTICNSDDENRREFIFNCGHSFCGDCVAKIYKVQCIPQYCEKSEPTAMKECLTSLTQYSRPNCPNCRTQITKIVLKKRPISEQYIFYTTDWNAEQEISMRILQFDLRKLRNRINLKGIIPTDRVDVIINEYKKFMVLKNISSDWDAEMLSPAPAIDMAWHEHILDTANYREFCEIFPQPVNHNPEGVFDVDEKFDRYRKTLGLYYQYFGYFYPRTHKDSIWLYPDFLESHGVLKGGFQLFVKTLTGKTITINVDDNSYVWELKLRIQYKEGIPMDQMRLIFCGSNLLDSKLCGELGIAKESTIHLVLKCRGC